MLGEIRLGFFVDGIGYYKDCSKLIYKIDSDSKIKHLVEGSILDIDEELYKVQSVELSFIPSPGRKHFHREKPIKTFYVSKAKVELMGKATKKSAIKPKKLEPVAQAAAQDEQKVAVKNNKSYNEDDFKSEFPHLVEKPKRTRKVKSKNENTTKQEKKSTRNKQVKTTKKTKEPKKSIKAKTTKKPKKVETQGDKRAKRRSRCKSCEGLFKSLGRHKCKKQKKQ